MIERYTFPEMKQIWSEENKFSTWLEVELAVCEAWHKLGKIPAPALKNIKTRAAFEIVRINALEAEVHHDLIAFLTSVAEKVGPDSRFIHLGLTSYDVEDTALSIRLKKSAEILIADINRFIEVLIQKAREHKTTLIMGRTHSVHAEPMTFGLKLAIWLAEMQRNLERMKRAKEVISYGKISGAVGTYANLPPEIEVMVCNTLGLKPSPASNQILQRDRHAEYLTTLAIMASSIDKFAVEIRHLQRSEVLEAEEPFGKKQKGSSAMPHKRNPIISERMSGLARLLRGNAHAALENIPLWHERDISHSSVERVILPDSNLLVDYMLQTYAAVIENLVIYPENMQKNIEQANGLFFSEKLLLALVEKGLTREEAYKLVQTAAMSARMKENLKDRVLKDPEIRTRLSEKEIEEIFNLGKFIQNIHKIFERLGI